MTQTGGKTHEHQTDKTPILIKTYLENGLLANNNNKKKVKKRKEGKKKERSCTPPCQNPKTKILPHSKLESSSVVLTFKAMHVQIFRCTSPVPTTLVCQLI